MTRDEVVLALKQCLRGSDGSICEKCPLAKEDFYKCRLILRDATIKLINESEPIKRELNAVINGEYWFNCGACKHPLQTTDKYCSNCGKKVKW